VSPHGVELTSRWGKGAFPRDDSPWGAERTSWWGEGEVSLEGWSPLGSGRNLPMGRRWGFQGRLVSLEE